MRWIAALKERNDATAASATGSKRKKPAEKPAPKKAPAKPAPKKAPAKPAPKTLKPPAGSDVVEAEWSEGNDANTDGSRMSPDISSAADGARVNSAKVRNRKQCQSLKPSDGSFNRSVACLLAPVRPRSGYQEISAAFADCVRNWRERLAIDANEAFWKRLGKLH